MTPERWAEVVSMFEQAERCSETERAALLAGVDPALRAEVESLLCHAGADEPAESVVAEAAAAALAPAVIDDVVGTQLGPFRIAALCGRGGMGVVYRAIDDRLGRTVALKLLPDEVAAEGERRRRFLREAKLAATVNHANIATIYEVGEAGGRMFIAMEFVTGRSLREVLAERRLAVPEALAIARQILAALTVAHDAGITHRDLKPDNVMLTAAGVAKVLDFGLAKHELAAQPTIEAETLTQAHGIRGTPSYMSPEQARGAAVDRRSDIFSFGVMLYELVTGTRPFVGVTTADVVSSILRDEPAPASVRNPDVSREVSEVIGRCLAKHPSARHASCTAVLSALDGAPDPGAGARTPHVARRRRAVVLVAGVAALGVAGLVGVSRLAGGSDAQPAPTSSDAGSYPRSSNPRALQLYRDGLKATRDGRLGQAELAFAEAVELDPELAAAHLRRAFVMAPFPIAGRASFRRALALRGSLDAREQGFLDATEPLFLRQPADVMESLRRMAELAKRYPDDGEVAFGLGQGRRLALDTTHEVLIEDFSRAIALDPEFGEASSELAKVHASVGDFAAGERDLARCLTATPSATICLRTRIQQREALGQCGLVEADARRWLTIEPDSFGASFALAGALEAQQRPVSAVREALRSSRRALTDAERADREARDEWSLAVLEGDFTKAVEVGEVRMRLVEASRSEPEHAEVARDQALLLEEMGRLEDAGRVATSFLAARDAWEPNPLTDDRTAQQDPTGSLLAIARRAKLLSNERVTEERATRLASAEGRVVRRFRSFLWVMYYAAGVETADEAREALAALERFKPFPAYSRGPYVDVDAAIGRTLLLGGRADEALPILERATRACYGLRFPVEHVRASFFLGEARAAKGDTAGACAAYRRVLDRWGTAKPRSVTADRARARSKALGCDGVR